MAFAATAEGFPSSVTSAPRVLALQRVLVWLVGASGAIVFIEPSPYELMTLTSAVVFFATGVRLRLAFLPLLLLLFLINIGYSIGAIPFMDKPEVANWIATSWYMAVTVIFFAMVIAEDYSCAAGHASPRPDRGRVDSVNLGHCRLFQPRSRRTRPADTIRTRARHLQGSERAGRVPDPSRAVSLCKASSPTISENHSAVRSRWASLRSPSCSRFRGQHGVDLSSRRHSCWR